MQSSNEQNPDVTCDECRNTFTIDSLAIEQLKDGIERTYFTCPHCQQDYTSYYTDLLVRQTLQKMKPLRVLYARALKRRNLVEAEKQQHQLNQYIASNKKRMQFLKERVESRART